MAIESDIGFSTRDEIFVRGRSLTRELMGKIDFTEMCILEMTGELPSAELSTLVNAILVMLSDHGLMPSVIAARMTHLGAPESIQGAVAAGILGAGNHFLGTTQNAAEMLQAALGGSRAMAGSSIDAAATAVIDDHAARGQAIAGLGHPLHKRGDPRAQRLFEIAEECGFHGSHCRLLLRIEELVSVRREKPVPINAAGAVGAVVSDIGWAPVMARSLSLIARVPGLLAHIIEEAGNPQADKMWSLVMNNSNAFDLKK